MVGDIVIAPFLFTDLQGYEYRPVVVVAQVSTVDWVVCQMTSRQRRQPGDIAITRQDIRAGRLRGNSWVPPGYLQTLHEDVFGRTIDRLTDAKLAESCRPCARYSEPRSVTKLCPHRNGTTPVITLAWAGPSTNSTFRPSRSKMAPGFACAGGVPQAVAGRPATRLHGHRPSICRGPSSTIAVRSNNISTCPRP